MLWGFWEWFRAVESLGKVVVPQSLWEGFLCRRVSGKGSCASESLGRVTVPQSLWEGLLCRRVSGKGCCASESLGRVIVS